MQIDKNSHHYNAFSARASSVDASANSDSSFLADLKSLARNNSADTDASSNGLASDEKQILHQVTGFNLIDSDGVAEMANDDGSVASGEQSQNLKDAAGAFRTAGTDDVGRVAPGVLKAVSIEGNFSQTQGSAGTADYYNEVVQAIMKQIKQL